jgi:hypothetical protein
MIPHGNCRDTTKSRGVVHKHETVPPWHNYVMSEFVLDNDLRDNGRNK